MKDYLKNYLKLLKFVFPFKQFLILAALCMGVSTIFDGATLGMIVPLSDRVLTNKEIVIPGDLPQFLASIVNKLNSLEPVVLLKFMVFFTIGLFFFKGLFNVLQSHLMNIVGQGVIREVRNQLYDKFHQLCMQFYGKKRTGELMSRVTSDVNLITNSLSYGLTDLIYQTMQVIFFTFIALYLGFKISWKLSLIAFIIFPAIMIPVTHIGKRIKKYTIHTQQKMADLNSLLAETIQGAYIVKAFCREKYESDRFKKINFQYYRFTLKSLKRLIVMSPLTEFIGACGAVTILWIVGREVIADRLSFGVFGLFLASLMSMIRPLKKLSNVHAINQRALAASARIYDILEEEPKVKEKSNAEVLKDFKSGISFKDVTFAYDPADGDVIKDVNLDVKKGQVIALVGHSGAGKSTIINLLLRFYDPQKGTISIDGTGIKDVTISSLRSLIAVVSQEMVLFNATVRDNIAYGREGASEEKIIEAAKKGHAFEFVSDLPEGFDTVVGDRGFRLSGGQKQRIAIARAILKDAPILVFDEATSQLDSASEQLVKEAFYSLMEKKTVFVIAHRLSTVQRADRIIVLDGGRIVEEGRHEDLMSKDSRYKRLYDLQFNA